MSKMGKGSDIIHQVGTVDVNMAATPPDPSQGEKIRKSIIARIVMIVLLLALLVFMMVPKDCGSEDNAEEDKASNIQSEYILM